MAHYDRNWDELGRNIRDAVEWAVNSQDFQRLNEKIRQTVARTEAWEQDRPENKRLYCSTPWKSIQAFLCMLIGIPTALFGFFGILSAVPYSPNPIATVVASAGFLAVGGWLFLRGRSLRSMVRRFKVYRETLGTGTHCSLKLLASAVEKDQGFVRGDLRKMIDKGFFLEGHLNREQTHFLASHESYRYYEQSRIELEQRQKQAPESESTVQSAELQEVLARGKSYIEQVRKCNDDIPGEEISEKISRIELLAQRIFDRVREHPEVIPDLKKLMDYYLPMTVKLLRAYADMDMQPVQGETIRASKREIEGTLDTVNTAFEKLLDDLFEETAMDVSSDISVLNTLLAQEGLVEDGLNRKKES